MYSTYIFTDIQKAKRKAEAVEELANGGEEHPIKKKKKKEKADAAVANGGEEVLAAASTETDGKKKVSAWTSSGIYACLRLFLQPSRVLNSIDASLAS